MSSIHLRGMHSEIERERGVKKISKIFKCKYVQALALPSLDTFRSLGWTPENSGMVLVPSFTKFVTTNCGGRDKAFSIELTATASLSNRAHGKANRQNFPAASVRNWLKSVHERSRCWTEYCFTSGPLSTQVNALSNTSYQMNPNHQRITEISLRSIIWERNAHHQRHV
jgi:hypothetical protein